MHFSLGALRVKVLGTLSECQTVWIQIRTDILLVLIWVQTVCKGYQQTTWKVAASKERVKNGLPLWLTSKIKCTVEACTLPTSATNSFEKGPSTKCSSDSRDGSRYMSYMVTHLRKPKVHSYEDVIPHRGGSGWGIMISE